MDEEENDSRAITFRLMIETIRAGGLPQPALHIKTDQSELAEFYAWYIEDLYNKYYEKVKKTEAEAK